MEFAENYRDILKDLIGKKPRGETTRIAERLDVSPALLSQVLGGTRHITPEQALSVASHFELTKLETDYFISTVQKARSTDMNLSHYWALRIQEIKESLLTIRQSMDEKIELDDATKAVFYSSYLYSAIRLFCSIGGGKSLEDVHDKFQISREKATQILGFLCKTNLVTYANNKYTMATKITFVPKESDFVNRHHVNWRLKGMRNMEDSKTEELYFTCPCSLDKETFQELKKDILKLISNSLKKTAAAPAEEVACMNIDLFFLDH